MKRLLTLGLALLVLTSYAACAAQADSPAEDPQEAAGGLFAMDTYINLTAYGSDAEAALELAEARIQELESLWSVTDEGSEVYAANHSGGAAASISADTEELLRFALNMAQETGGTLEVIDQSVVVSGGYEKYFVGEDVERYWHIIDPETGYPARSGLVQAAIVSRESKLCDALSTAIFVMGLDKAIDYWQVHQNFDMILLTDDRDIYVTEGLQEAFTLSADHEGQEVQVITHET